MWSSNRFVCNPAQVLRHHSHSDLSTSSVHVQAEEFLEHLCRAVAAELDGSQADMQLLFGVNTLARGEFQRILQELTHWMPLVKVTAFSCHQANGNGMMPAILGAESSDMKANAPAGYTADEVSRK